MGNLFIITKMHKKSQTLRSEINFSGASSSMTIFLLICFSNCLAARPVGFTSGLF